MDERGSVAGATRHWTLSWTGLAVALGLHVADEAANDFLAFWDPLVRSLRERALPLPLPTSSFGMWLGGLIVVVVVLLILTWFVRRGATWMRPVSYALAVVMVGNGLLHTLGSIYEGRVVPGVYSSPVLVIAAGLLFATAWRHRNATATGSDLPDRR
jgi:hypothetical protein